MAEELKSLIEKIQVEGIQAAEEKARAIDDEARLKAKAILAEAKSSADKLIAEAKERIAKMEEASNLAVKQAGRDTLISLKKEINTLLDKVIKSGIREAITPHELGKIISNLIKESGHKHKDGIEVTLNKEDLEKIDRGFLGELKEEIKKGITLKASEEISAGFLISFDSGKSHFDFSDAALADYLSAHIKPKLAEILK